jgi:hypothetical protein
MRDRMRAALIKDLARLLGVAEADITVTSMAVGSLIVNFTVAADSQVRANAVASTTRSLAASNVTLSEATVVYREANPSADRLTVSQSSASASTEDNSDNNNDADSAAFGPQLLLIASAVVAAFAVAAVAN